MALCNTYKNVELRKDILKVPTYLNVMNHYHNNITAYKVQGSLLMMLLNSYNIIVLYYICKLQVVVLFKFTHWHLVFI